MTLRQVYVYVQCPGDGKFHPILECGRCPQFARMAAREGPHITLECLLVLAIPERESPALALDEEGCFPPRA
jgi:hypothetical protein